MVCVLRARNARPYKLQVLFGGAIVDNTAKIGYNTTNNCKKENKMLLNFVIDEFIKNALKEDINYIDVATDFLIPEGQTTTAVFTAKDEGVICGIDIALRVFEILDPDCECCALKNNGDRCSNGELIARISGNTRALLKGERTALNILQLLSGISTATRIYQDICDSVFETTGKKTYICETRKTLPGLRAFEKSAVLCGGGHNHRYNLSDAAMIKDNHIDAYGSIKGAVSALREKIGHMTKIEVEVKNTAELYEALESKADVIMLDNMTTEQMSDCVSITAGRAFLEASGNITAERVKAIAETGVDVISSGALTHSVKAFDISMTIAIANKENIT
jgi:nicotinate-nucleotide pyrophosphorylase (carboxylating)